MSDKSIKQRVISFRVPQEQAHRVETMLKDNAVLGVHSVNQYFRKIAQDYLDDRMVHKNPPDALIDAALKG
jgi:hypothetical protein